MKKKKSNKWLRYSWNDRLFLVFIHVFVLLVAFICLYPMYFTVIASFSDSSAVYAGKTNLWVKGFNLDAYRYVLMEKSIWTGYRNTIFYTFFGTCFNLFLTIPSAYALSKRNMYGRGLLTFIFLFTMYFGGGMIPTYLLFKDMHMLNTPWIMIISGGISVYNVIVTRTYFQNNIPETMYEAARIDGANELYIFYRIALPLSKAIIAVMALYYAVGHWGSYFGALLYVRNEDLYPLQLVLRKILILNTGIQAGFAEFASSPEAIEAAMKKAEMANAMKYSLVFIASLPMLILYPFIQKHFVKGIMIGSLKG